MTSNDADIQAILRQVVAERTHPVVPTLSDGVLADYLGDNDDPREVLVRGWINRHSIPDVSVYEEVRKLAGGLLRHTVRPDGWFKQVHISELAVSAWFFVTEEAGKEVALVDWHPATDIKPYTIQYYATALTDDDFYRLFRPYIQ